VPLPIAHGLLGASVVAALWPASEPRRGKMILLGAVLAISPDFDYALNWLRIDYGGWHHGFTHSIPFALLIGFVMIAVFRDWRLRSYLVFTLAYVSHTLLDFMFTESRGIALWWPFTNYRYKLRLPYPIDYAWSRASWLETVVDVVKLCVAELLIFAPILFIVILIRHTLTKRSRPEAAPALD
jgi:membrane-bound metal-dependent hydrolase YbcI (DUF457 family)